MGRTLRFGRKAGPTPQPDVVPTSVYLPEPVHRKLRNIEAGSHEALAGIVAEELGPAVIFPHRLQLTPPTLIGG